MNAFDLTKRRWLFCMTHPDDEISICCWIKRLAENGNEVFISWTHSNPIREAEARKVSELLGVSQENLYFHNATDGFVCTEVADLLPKFESMIAEIQPDAIACGAFEQGHVDHDTTNFLVNLTYQGDIFEIPFYHSYSTKLQTMNAFSDPTGQSELWLTPQEIKLKRLVAKQYRSQNIWQVLLWFEIWQLAMGKTISLSKREVMRLQQHKMFRHPNHPSALAAKIERSEQWKWWCENVLPHTPR